jgi:Outer membrane protein beta-barrel domain
MRFQKTLISAAALAATLAAHPAHADTWTGCHLGLSAGLSNVGWEPYYGADGTRVGALGGCDYQVTSHLVVGGSAAYEWTTHEFAGPEYEGEAWTLAATGGVLLNANTLAFAKLGITQIDIDGETFDGDLVGAGLRISVAEHVHLVAEYNRVKYDGGETLGGIDPEEDVVKVSALYVFPVGNAPEPVAALTTSRP